LSGTREYEDKKKFWRSLNEEGQGLYDWEEGWLENHELKKRAWKACGFMPAMIRKEGLSYSGQMIYLWLEAVGGIPELLRTVAPLSWVEPLR